MLEVWTARDLCPVASVAARSMREPGRRMSVYIFTVAVWVFLGGCVVVAAQR